MGRRRKVTVKELLADVENYIANADPPIVAEFAMIHNITREHIYHLAKTERENGRPELYHAIRRIIDAKEIRLEKGGLNGHYNPSMARFSLKQLGWRDTPIDADPGSEGVIVLPEAEDNVENRTTAHAEGGTP